jgi:carboxypeptidase Q
MLVELGLVPRRTIRVVLFTNEENGLRGARAYFDAHGHETHVAAIEADAGSGEPRGFSIAHGDEARVERIASWAPAFRELGADHIRPGWGGADIGPLMQAGVPGIAVRPDGSEYFDVHHSPADTIDKVDPDHLQRNAAAMALMAFLLAEAE